jgi:hypothetical protein
VRAFRRRKPKLVAASGEARRGEAVKNLKTAKGLDVTVPLSILQPAD